MNMQILHFGLGPVQTFVAQARRTRDLWAGSFLLSWLTGHAMSAVRRQGGCVLFPSVVVDKTVTDPLIAAIEEQPLSSDLQPQIGSLPNRFKAEVPEAFDVNAVEKAVRERWGKLAEAVWTQFVEPAAMHGHGTRDIWDRQVDNFWDIYWVIGESPEDHNDVRWLDLRKNWRTYWPHPEGGEHCSLMGEFQELSGFDRVGRSEELAAFWEKLAGGIGILELRDNERLCAIALIKRLFPRLSEENLKQAIGWVPGGNRQAIGNWPSTAYMAVVPWLRDFAGNEERSQELRQYGEQVEQAAGNSAFGERSTHIKSLEPLGKLAGLDGNFFLPAALANMRDTPLRDEQARASLCNALGVLQKDHPAQPYYALLLLDGDNLGRHLSKPDGNSVWVSQCLATFSRGVAKIVGGHDGVTLYAGGDDVLALLPLDCGLDCAVELREAYGEAFNSELCFTASAAIVYAHYRLPLRGILDVAHRQLDEVAKDANGRDSLALAWLKASGMAAEWVATWRDAGQGESVRYLKTLVKEIEQDKLGSGFFYKIKSRYPMLEGPANPEYTMRFVERLLQAEYIKSRERSISVMEAEQAIKHLLNACRPSRRDRDGAFEPTAGLQLGGLRLARLLAGKEIRA